MSVIRIGGTENFVVNAAAVVVCMAGSGPRGPREKNECVVSRVCP